MPIAHVTFFFFVPSGIKLSPDALQVLESNKAKRRRQNGVMTGRTLFCTFLYNLVKLMVLGTFLARVWLYITARAGRE
jgi:hypothetical protein